jgi:hypothetical protein
MWETGWVVVRRIMRVSPPRPMVIVSSAAPTWNAWRAPLLYVGQLLIVGRVGKPWRPGPAAGGGRQCQEGESGVTPLERRCRLLLRAYPGWYRRERAEEMLGTLLEASPAHRRWPSFRDARGLIIGGLRVRGVLVWCLSMLWAGLGALGAGYDFMLSVHVPEASYIGIQPWIGESGVIYAAADLGALAWFLLTIPVLVAGLVRLYRRRLRAGPGAWVAAVAWAGAWVAGLALTVQVGTWQPSAPAVLACSKNLGCSLAGYRHAVVSWEELAVFAGWLALGTAMTLILARPMPGRDLSDASSRRCVA